jgi:hypothetical protein
MDTALQSRCVVLLTPIDTPTIGIHMRRIKANSRRLALKKETVRTLDERELPVVSAGWECSAKGSGNIKCSPDAGGDSVACAASC